RSPSYLFSRFPRRRPPRRSPLFPYTTLFRSAPTFGAMDISLSFSTTTKSRSEWPALLSPSYARPELNAPSPRMATTLRSSSRLRSEEHTSELQSHLNLVCRLLLEKKTTRHPS